MDIYGYKVIYLIGFMDIYGAYWCIYSQIAFYTTGEAPPCPRGRRAHRFGGGGGVGGGGRLGGSGSRHLSIVKPFLLVV